MVLSANQGLGPGDKAIFEIEADPRLRPAGSRVRRHYGSVPTLRKPGPREEREAFEEGVAADVVAEDQ